MTAIIMLWPREEGHTHLGGVIRISGNIISVGRRTFSIVGGLGFVGGLFRVFGRWLRGVLVLRWLHMLRRLEEALGLPSTQ